MLTGQRTTLALCPAPLLSTSICYDSGKAAVNPSNHPWNARLLRYGSARKKGAPVIGSTAPSREKLAHWCVTVATGWTPQAVIRRRTMGSRPRWVSAWAKTLLVPVDERLDH